MVVIGHSRGGFAVLRAMIDDLVRPWAAVIVDIAPELVASGMRRGLDEVLEERRFGTPEQAAAWLSSCGLAASDDDAAELVPYHFTLDGDGCLVPKHDPRAFVPEHQEISAGRMPAGSPRPDDLMGITAPMLLLRGERSAILSAASAERFVSAVPGASLATVAGARHAPHLQNVDGFVSAVRRFLEGVAEQAGPTTAVARRRSTT